MSQSPNVLLLIFDSLRADTAASDVMPTLDRLRERGTDFESAFAAGPWTPPSHGAIFSGRYPSTTGFNGAWPSMPESVPLVAELFENAGYDTLGVPGPSKMGSPVGLDRGFTDYYEVYEDIAERPSIGYAKQVLTDRSVRRDFLRTVFRGNDYYTGLRFEKLRSLLGEADAPWFGMANLTTVHAPYSVPEPYLREETPGLSRPWPPVLEDFGRTPTLDCEDVRSDRLFPAADGADATTIAMRQTDGDGLNSVELNVLRAWYRACARYLNDRLADFLDWLESTNEVDDTVIVATADHGEFFGEHGALYHGNFLHDEVLHVPLIITGPGVPEGESRCDLVSLVDLLPTLGTLTGIDTPGTEGQPLFGDGTRDAVFAEEATSDESGTAPDVSRAVRDRYEAGRKSVRTDSLRLERSSDGTERLYRVPSGERVESPDEAVLTNLRELLSETLGDDFHPGTRASSEVSEGVKRNLRELGYR
ncbi:sulfatase [Halolamina sp. C58]|uniref:sulfatase n=1 Tax=Halolamina sp. C58 TaxID=3421640 RepID=UPI003EBEECF2